MSSNEPVKNGCEVIYEMFHILNCGFEQNHRSCVCNLNCNNASNVRQLQPSKLRMSSACSIIIILGISCTVNYLEAHWVAGIYFVWFEI